MSLVNMYITVLLASLVCVSEGNTCHLFSFINSAGNLIWAVNRKDAVQCKQLLIGGHRGFTKEREVLTFDKPFFSSNEEAVREFLCTEANACNENDNDETLTRKEENQVTTSTAQDFDSSSPTVQKMNSSCTNDSTSYSCFCNNNTVTNGSRSCQCIDQRPNATQVQFIPNDCYQLKSGGIQENGIYIIQTLSQRRINVNCDMDTDCGGWTIIQRRADGSEDFDRTWNDYKVGFGLVNLEFWLGNENLHQLTKQKRYTLLIEMTNINGDSLTAKYDNFTVGGEDDKYQLVSLGSFSGTKGLVDGMRCHETMDFTTLDSDNDHDNNGNCAEATSSGWWFNGGSEGITCTDNNWCKEVNLNGVYGAHDGSTSILWGYSNQGLTNTEMKIRP